MLTIRLQRMGKKNSPTYRLVVAEKGRDTQGRNLEILGAFNPHAKENGLTPNAERIKYWLAKGAQTSNTVHNLLLKAGVTSGDKKKKSVYISKTRAAKLASAKGGSASGGEKATTPVEAPAALAAESAAPAAPETTTETAPAPEQPQA